MAGDFKVLKNLLRNARPWITFSKQDPPTCGVQWSFTWPDRAKAEKISDPQQQAPVGSVLPPIQKPNTPYDRQTQIP
jgi:hypothetical protein